MLFPSPQLLHYKHRMVIWLLLFTESLSSAYCRISQCGVFWLTAQQIFKYTDLIVPCQHCFYLTSAAYLEPYLDHHQAISKYVTCY
jgi:hypothetical protein